MPAGNQDGRINCEVVLATLNAKYLHCALGLRYLLANLGSLRSRTVLREFDINQRPLDIAAALLALEPKIIGLGIYIWNVAPTTELVAILKQVRPEVIIVLGGPEVSFESGQQILVQRADQVITGEADLKFAEVCEQWLAGQPVRPKIIPAEPPDLERVALPYDLYSDHDLSERLVYVESSRGCPFTCEFCLSSLDLPVRRFPLPVFLGHLERLLERGARHFKFVDRTFNVHLRHGLAILEFFRDRQRPGLFLHFEMVPDRLPDEYRQILQQFPRGAVQFEIGVQTFNSAVAERIQRRQNIPRLEENLRFLRDQTGVHLHTDLIAGLPGESWESFAAGFDRLLELRPHEIQVGILKRLRGTPIVRHDAEWQMVYNPNPPYEILQNKLLDFKTLHRLRRFARTWDLVANSGNFLETTPCLWQGNPSACAGFMAWSDWLGERAGSTHGIALARLAEYLFEYLTGPLGLDHRTTAAALLRDYQRGGRSDVPKFLRPFVDIAPANIAAASTPGLDKRQQRHARQRTWESS